MPSRKLLGELVGGRVRFEQRLRVGRKARVADDPGGAGYEIAKEARACIKCAHDYEAIRAAAGDESFG